MVCRRRIPSPTAPWLCCSPPWRCSPAYCPPAARRSSTRWSRCGPSRLTMRALRAFLVRLGGCLRRTHREQELSNEIESHLQFHTDDNVRAGMSPDEARRQAVVKLGSVEAVKEEMRDR